MAAENCEAVIAVREAGLSEGANLPTMKTEYKIILLSSAAGVILWLTDLIVDSIIYAPASPFMTSLESNIYGPSSYRHSFIVIVFIFFGLLISKKVSEQKKLEGRLVRAKYELEETFNSITDSITIHDSEFNIIWANRAAETLLGISLENDGGLKCHKCYHGKDSPPEECPSCETLRTGRPSVFQRYEPFLNKHFEIRTMPRFDEGRKVMGVIHIVRDITYKKELQTSLTESQEELTRHRDQLMELVEERTIELQKVNDILLNEIDGHREAKARESALLMELKTIFENLPVGIVYLDHDYTVISTNRFFTSLIRKVEEDIIGKTCYETVGEFARDPAKTGQEKICSYCKIESCLHSKRPISVERPLADRIVSVTTIPEADESGNIVRFLNMIEDITDRRRAEAEAVRASHLAALGELAAGVAHEINNPVNGIINYSQMLANRNEPGSGEHDIASRIIKEGDRIAGIVRALLFFARDRREDKYPVHVRDIITDTLALTEAHLKKDGIRFTANVPEHLPMVTVQPQQIEQVFLNVISNAKYALNEKFAGAHKNKVIDVAAESIDVEGSQHVRIAFNDSGTGIPVTILNKVMNPFFTTKPVNTGTGLGLSISYGIINNHGGKIQIESVAGEYTRVIIDLPVSQKSIKN
ncbi:MAG: PAS domain-containing protein [Nitrospirae bacterium]|nr:PAS domain-containing protein [Nitrospirota bacterium]